MNSTVIAALVIVVGVFYFNKAWRTCSNCKTLGLRRAGQRKRYGELLEYKCIYCGAEQWKESLILPALRTEDPPDYREVWRQFANQIGAEFIGESDETCKVRARVKNWTITFSYVRMRVFDDEESHFHTRVDAPYLSKNGFEFMVHPRGAFSDLGKLFGAQHVEIGDPHIDDHFIIKANDESKVRALFAIPRIRQLIQAQPKFGRFGAGSNELYLHDMTDHIMDLKLFTSLFELFTETLNQLVEIGSASEYPPIRPEDRPIAPYYPGG